MTTLLRRNFCWYFFLLKENGFNRSTWFKRAE